MENNQQQQVAIDINVFKMELGERDIIIIHLREELRKAQEELIRLRKGEETKK